MADALGSALLVRARNAIADAMGLPTRAEPDAQGLELPGATFVTLTLEGELRGCIGSLEARRPLGQDVRDNARAAAFRDPRFPPLDAAEFSRVRVEVSLLSPPVPLDCADEADALRQLRPGVDGVILEAQGRRATFLPQVWEELPEGPDFLRHLRRKAGLPADEWTAGTRLSRYEVRQWTEAN